MNNNQNEAVNNAEDGALNIDIVEILRSFFRFWWLCVILAVIGAGIMFFKYYICFVPQYTCSATFTVSTETDQTIRGASTYAFYYNKMTAEQLSDTFPYLLNTEMLRNSVTNEMGLGYIPASLSMTSVDDTNMFTLYSKGGDPQKVYDTLVATIKCYPGVAKYVIGNIQIRLITDPLVPTEPSNTRNFEKKTLIGAAVGAVIGLMWILIYGIFRRTITDEEDVKTELRSHVVGFIPIVMFKKYKSEIDNSILITNPMVADDYKEEMKVLRNTIKSKIGDKKIIMLTSTAPGEGKTTISVNIAISFVQSGKKVLLVDGDMRNPSVGGALNCFVDEEPPKGCYIKHVDEFDLDLMEFNVDNKEIWNYLKVEKLSKLIHPLKEKYDLIIIDTPPCGLISDATIFSQISDMAFYVILQDTIRASRVRNSLEMLMNTDIEIGGCILNGVTNGIVSSYGHYGKYGYGKYGRYGGGRYGKYGYGRYGKYGYGRYGKYGYGKYGYGKYGYGYGYGEHSKSKSEHHEKSKKK